ncbi:MAG: rRNA pseudouridine synthase [Oscillospiraceae bacterium]|nr:rRNA pseudouridine synthase [Oscillospiraceae bacterium]
MERLQKILSARGVASRRDAEGLITAGRVTVDGIPAVLGQRADPFAQVICVDGKALSAPLEERTYMMLNKPVGYLTTVRDDRGRKTVMELLGACAQGLWPVGRLDRNSEGLLLLTDDGEVTRRLTHPSYGVEKIYRVWVSGGDLEQSATEMGAPLVIDGRPIQRARVRLIRTYGADGGILEVGIREGRNRQVRKMCDLCGLTVRRLMRVGEGQLQLGDLKIGAWRPLTTEEIAYLKKI